MHIETDELSRPEIAEVLKEHLASMFVPTAAGKHDQRDMTGDRLKNEFGVPNEIAYRPNANFDTTPDCRRRSPGEI